MRLIDADALKKQMCDECFGGNCGNRCPEWHLMNDAPTVDPFKHGHWINTNEGIWNAVEVLKCSVCGEIDNRMYRSDAYCPNCGAKMDERREDGDT